mmetsp:Transcript_25913/g.49642  ORF Transcript_25913/g.49642 Transcript_25913/m.49642 type:complete len:403 (+) Transcript_25913:64-1272(+)
MAASSFPESQQGTPPAADAEITVADAERQPLLDKRTRRFADDLDEWDSTQYDITKITSWRAFLMLKGCAWDNSLLWNSLGLGMLLVTAVTIATASLPNAVLIDPDKLARLGSFLNVFVGLLLGFFLSSSMNRWYGCVNAFLELLDAVRSMQMQMTALGVSQERQSTLSRYGILSAWLLHLSLCMESEDHKDVRDKTGKVWLILDKFRPDLALPQEKSKLMEHKESYALLWTWVASLIGRMSQDGEIPPMASPTYGRILHIVQQAYGSIRDVRALHMIKTPFIYVHTLAILVHVNNILNAIAFGLVCGIMCASLMGKFAGGGEEGWANLCTSLFLQFCFSMLAPVLYLALFDVSVCVAQPFTYQDAKIPAARFIVGMEEDLKNATHIGNHPLHWEKPSFKKRD